MTKELTCIVCPVGCRITVELDQDGKPLKVSGNSCPRGQAYAIKEFTNPERVLTTTVIVKGGEAPLVSVKSAKPLPKAQLFDAMRFLDTISAKAPIQIGDVIVKNILGTGIDIIATTDNHEA